MEKGEDGVRVTIPHADGNPDSRVYAYELSIDGQNELTTQPSAFANASADKPDHPTAKLLKATYAAGVNMGVGHEPNKGVTTIDILEKELPKGDVVTLSVTPLSSLGTRGAPITVKYESNRRGKV